MTGWDKFFDEKMREIAQTNYILDAGGGTKFGKGLKRYQGLFEGKKYVTLDKDPSTNPDIVGDIHDKVVAGVGQL